jgi:hypothetical protein
LLRRRQLWAEVDQLLKQVKAAITETRFQGTLTAEKPEQVHELKATAGIVYLIDLHSTAFDTHLKLRDGKGELLGQHHDPAPTSRDSRLVFTPKETGTYRLVAASFSNWGRGAYTLTIRAIAGKGK